MKLVEVKNYLEVIGIFGVIISLAFVGVQLQQDRVIARSELGANTFEGNRGNADSVIAPEFARVYAKMLETPAELTVQEMVMLNGFFTQISDQMARECYLVERGLFVECDELLRDNIRRYFRSSYAQAWWKLSDTRSPIELPSWVDDAIANGGGDFQLERIKAIKALAISK